MKKLKYYSLSLFIIFAIFLFILGGLYLFQKYKLDSIARNEQKFDKLLLISGTINEHWREGDFEELLKKEKMVCKKLGRLRNTGDEFLRCNPEYMRCFLKRFYKEGIKAKIVDETLNHIMVEVNYEGDKDGLSLILENNCHEVYLPKRNYGHALGHENEKILKWRFDNFNRDIYIDQFLVSNFDINRWVSISDIKIKKIIDKNKLSLPATHLTKTQMRKYCAYRGKQLVPAHIYDAATIYPSLKNKKDQKVSMLYPYPFMRNKTNFFLNKILKLKDVKITPAMCRKVYIKECKNITPFTSYDTKSSSWIGLHQVLGGYKEYHPNTLFPKRHVRLSSMDYSGKSKIHKLAVRGEWTNKIKDVGFRCMREVSD